MLEFEFVQMSGVIFYILKSMNIYLLKYNFYLSNLDEHYIHVSFYETNIIFIYR